MQPIGLFGGTFDPIHYGHLRTAFELRQLLRLTEVRFLPTGNPPHREQTIANAELRLRMVRAAVAGEPAFTVDDREMRRSGVSYSVDTLAELRAEHPHRSLLLRPTQRRQLAAELGLDLRDQVGEPVAQVAGTGALQPPDQPAPPDQGNGVLREVLGPYDVAAQGPCHRADRGQEVVGLVFGGGADAEHDAGGARLE